MKRTVFAVLILVGVLGCVHADECDDNIAQLTVALCMDPITPFSQARTYRQRQRSCRGAYEALTCLENYILTCAHAMSSLQGALEQLSDLRENRLKLDLICHANLESC